jgi:selenocysteine lyase/cysteine desulfurase
MPVVRRWAFFDHAGVSPLPHPTLQAMTSYATDLAENGAANWSSWMRRVEVARALTARLLHASPADIAMVRNTTEGVTLVAEGFPWQPGDNVVLPDIEFPSNRLPWTNLASRGVEVRLVAAPQRVVDLEAIESACDRRTRIVAASWVDYAAGWRIDAAALAEIAHRHGALLFLDVIQGLGVIPLDVTQTPVDFLAADGHKWLLGPEGAGVMYVRPQHLDVLRPFGLGWNSRQSGHDFSQTDVPLKTAASRYEGGTFPLATFVGLAASLELLTQQPLEHVHQRLRYLTDLACERLQRLGAAIATRRQEGHDSGIIAFELPGQEPHQVVQRCRAHGVYLNVRAGRIRLSPHVYNDEGDLERLIGVLQAAGE